MAGMRMRMLTLLAAMVIVSTALRAEEIKQTNWQNAVANLGHERSQAEMCVRLLKKFGDKTTIEYDSVAHDTARAEHDGIIGGLIAWPSLTSHRIWAISRTGCGAASRSGKPSAKARNPSSLLATARGRH